MNGLELEKWSSLLSVVTGYARSVRFLAVCHLLRGFDLLWFEECVSTVCASTCIPMLGPVGRLGTLETCLEMIHLMKERFFRWVAPILRHGPCANPWMHMIPWALYWSTKIHGLLRWQTRICNALLMRPDGELCKPVSTTCSLVSKIVKKPRLHRL